jgi:hypothetical protein
MPTRILLLAAMLLGLACAQMPNRGTPVVVDMRAGRFWTGDGMLLEVSDDKRRCLVAVRDRAYLVQQKWVDCAHVHPKSVERDVQGRPVETF